ncbi:DUF3850 domain-containing protein [Patescibacteria group bacterium]|nr:DUF3850 domain-containing protein [Patescibacteria group bacterium]
MIELKNMIIRKKVQQKYFQAVEEGRKRFEVRLADFKSKPGDALILEEQEEGTRKLTGRKIECEVLYVFNIKDVEKFYKKRDLDKYRLVVLAIRRKYKLR